MKNLRLLTIATIIGLTILFNIERLDLGRDNVVDIVSFVYILTVLAVITTITVPAIKRVNGGLILAFWLVIYLLGKLFLFETRPFWGGVYTYLTITEMALLSLSVWLSHRLALAMHDFEDAVENLTMVNLNGRVRSLDQAADDIQVEMFRSRHHHHPLSVIVVEPKKDSLQVALHQAVKEVQETIMRSYVITKLADSLSRHLRRTDLVLEERERGRFIILCPDTSARDLNVLVEYIQATATEMVGVTVDCGMATFPDEALTFEELVRQAETRLSYAVPETDPANGYSGPLIVKNGTHQPAANHHP